MIQDTEKTALLVMDVQAGIIANLPNKEKYLANVQKVIDAAHKRSIPVIFVVVGFREHVPEITSRNKAFESMLERISTAMVNPKPCIEPTNGDIVVTKRRFSAFSGSDLEVILRAHGVEELVLLGVSTSGVVLSTTREAADKDYRITILADVCADTDPDVHRALIEKILPRQAEVTTSSAWMGS